MIEARKKLNQLETRMEVVLSKSSNQPELMQQIMSQMEDAGSLEASGPIRTDSVMMFVMDVLTDNPAAMDWMGTAMETLEPLKINSEEALLEALSQ